MHLQQRIVNGLAIALWCLSAASAQSAAESSKAYQVLYAATLDPSTRRAQVAITLAQTDPLVRSVSLLLPQERYQNIASTAQIETHGDRVIWYPASTGGTLQFDVVIDRQRTNGAADARITDRWALLKLDHLFPSATSRVTPGAVAEAQLQINAPKGWSVETPYGWGAKQTFMVSDPDRNFDQPRGWMLAGDIAVRREKVGDRHISIASPKGSHFRANDMLAYLRWTLPSLIDILPSFPARILIVSGDSDMWRGGLSGRASLYLHPDRPLISGNRTSPVLHELFHVASRLHGKGGADWIVEGLAEYYSLYLLQRAGGISQYRYDKAFEKLAQWSDGALCTATDQSQGKQTAKAALVMRALDAEIRSRSDDRASLNTLVQTLVAAGRTVTNSAFRQVAEQLVNGPVRALVACP